MDLTKKYMENQGTLGYLHERKNWDVDNYVLVSYAKEGRFPEYHYCEEDVAYAMVKHWGETGDLIIKEYDFPRNQETIKMEHPTIVNILRLEKSYRRRMHPPEDTE